MCFTKTFLLKRIKFEVKVFLCRLRNLLLFGIYTGIHSSLLYTVFKLYYYDT